MVNKLVAALTRYTDAHPGQNAIVTEVPGVLILRSDQKRRPRPVGFKPALCFIAQGAKAAVFGEKTVRYGAGHALVATVELPGVGWVAQASPEAPMLGIAIELDLTTLRSVYQDLEEPPAASSSPRQGVVVARVDGPLADCFMRLMRLLAMPRAVGVLYPGIMREICYWLLDGPHGGDIVQMTLATGHAEPIVRAIHALRDRFDTPVRIEELASIAHLSPSAFHRQFKELTSMTPLQYQKQFRLLEARRLMVSDSAGAESAAFRVGYASASQFSREYARMFGRPPRRDVESRLGILDGRAPSSRSPRIPDR